MLPNWFSPLERIFYYIEYFSIYWNNQYVPLLAKLIADLPTSIWWIPLVILLILAGTALFDAYKGRVPDMPIIIGIFLVTAGLAYYSSWLAATHHLLSGIGAAASIWAMNHIYYNAFKHDAIGMGDAKWTALAVTAFGFKPALWAWVIGAWLGISWLALKALFSMLRGFFGIPGEQKYFYESIHFAPFLFLGLSAGLYWNYLR